MANEQSIKAVREMYAAFGDFLHDVWMGLQLPQPTARQYEIADFMQHGGSAVFVAGQRGIGKSWIAASYGIWRLLHDPSVNVFTLSASAEKANELSLFAKRLLTNPRLPMLHHLAPAANSRDNIARWDVAPAPNQQMPSWKAIGVEGQIQGARSNLVILDDIESMANSKTPMSREQLLRQAMDVESTKIPDDPNAQTIWLGTYQSTDSIYKQLRERGVASRMWPSRYPSADAMAAYSGCLAPSIEKELEQDPGLASAGIEGRGAPVDPQRFGDEFLLQRERLLGKAQFELQFQLNPHLSDLDAYPLRCEDVIVAHLTSDGVPDEIAPSGRAEDQAGDLPCVGHSGDSFYRAGKWEGTTVPYDHIVCAIDPSGSGRDETAWVIAAVTLGRMFVLDWGGRQDGASQQTLDVIAKACRRWSVAEILLERNFGGGTWTELLQGTLRKVYPCSVTEVQAKGSKEQRIADILEPIVQARKLVMDERAIASEFTWASRQELPEAARARLLVYQMAHLKREKGCLEWDDRVDALAIAAQSLRKHVGLDPDEQAARLRDERLDAALESFRDSVINPRAPKGNSWVTLPGSRR